MKREIKFRAWDKENEVLMYLDEPETKWEFTETGLTVSYLNEIHYEGGGEIHTKYEWEVLDCEVMQYTGLKDKNGKEIYEGDLIDVCGTRDKFQIVWKGIGFWFMNLDTNELYVFDTSVYQMVVIGNIHEHPLNKEH